jgi:hypothetical protein
MGNEYFHLVLLTIIDVNLNHDFSSIVINFDARQSHNIKHSYLARLKNFIFHLK